jgi:hypothetical protein
MFLILELSLTRLYEDCKTIPHCPDRFDEWFALVMMVKDYVQWFSACKAYRNATAETHRRLRLRFINWPIYSREQRLRAALPLLRVGDKVHVETMDYQWFDGTVQHLARHAVTFDDGEDEPLVVRKSKINYLELL